MSWESKCGECSGQTVFSPIKSRIHRNCTPPQAALLAVPDRIEAGIDSCGGCLPRPEIAVIASGDRARNKRCGMSISPQILLIDMRYEYGTATEVLRSRNFEREKLEGERATRR